MVRTLLVLVILLKSFDCLSALPDSLDKALIYMGKSDKELKLFYHALSHHQYAEMEEFYKMGAKNLITLNQILGKLLLLKLNEYTKEFRLKEILIVQLQILKEKMNAVFKSKVDADQE